MQDIGDPKRIVLTYTNVLKKAHVLVALFHNAQMDIKVYYVVHVLKNSMALDMEEVEATDAQNAKI